MLDSLGILVVDGEIRAILTEFAVRRREFILLLVAELYATTSQEIAYLAFLVGFAEDRPTVHVLVVCLYPVFLAVKHVGFHG